MANNYNKIRIPPVVVAKDGESKLIVKGQSYEDLISRELY
jgi:diaminopimelate decarboxylase